MARAARSLSTAGGGRAANSSIRAERPLTLSPSVASVVSVAAIRASMGPSTTTLPSLPPATGMAFSRFSMRLRLVSSSFSSDTTFSVKAASPDVAVSIAARRLSNPATFSATDWACRKASAAVRSARVGMMPLAW